MLHGWKWPERGKFYGRQIKLAVTDVLDTTIVSIVIANLRFSARGTCNIGETNYENGCNNCFCGDLHDDLP